MQACTSAGQGHFQCLTVNTHGKYSRYLQAATAHTGTSGSIFLGITARPIQFSWADLSVRTPCWKFSTWATDKCTQTNPLSSCRVLPCRTAWKHAHAADVKDQLDAVEGRPSDILCSRSLEMQLPTARAMTSCSRSLRYFQTHLAYLLHATARSSALCLAFLQQKKQGKCGQEQLLWKTKTPLLVYRQLKL